MAEVAALVAVKKIATALFGIGQSQLFPYISKEVDLFSQLPGSMSRIQREFLVMHTFLRNIESQESEEALNTWLHEVRKIAHEVEDIADEFIHLLGDKRLKGSFTIFKTCMGKIVGKPTFILEVHSVASRLKVLEDNLVHIIEVKDRWVKQATDGGKSISLMYPKRGGFQTEHYREYMDKLNSLLRGDGYGEVIAIWGPMGVGKSALVHELYVNEEKQYPHALVEVPPGCSSDELLRLIVTEIRKNEKKEADQEDDKISASELLLKVLGEKKYLIILDGIQEIEDFNNVSSSFPHNNSDSRIIFTTKFKGVADLAQESCRIEIKPMKEDDSKQLFRSRASQGGPLPLELAEVEKKVIRMCEGLPLAVVCVANALSRLEKKEKVWEGFINEIQWHLKNNGSLRPLKFAVDKSLKNLPKYLKSCLFFCSMFPVEHVFRRKRLIRLLVAEGFIEQRGQSLLEEVAEQCLTELADRCMFQVVEWNTAGRIKRIKMHAAMHIIVSAKSKRESFSMFCDKVENLKNYSEARHLCLHKCNVQNGSTIDVPNLRSFMASESGISSDFSLQLIHSCKYLTVLDLEKSRLEKLPDEIEKLFNLRYLNLRSTKVRKLPKSVGKLANLQTFDIVFTRITELPHEVAKLKKLRHFFAGVPSTKPDEFDFLTGVRAPNGIKDLKDLQTLYGMNANDKFLLALPTLSHLRTLTITKVESIHLRRGLCAALKKLVFLSSLRIVATNENENLNFSDLDGALNPLQRLELHCKLSNQVCISLVSCLAESPNFTYLYLGWTRLEMDPLPILSKLKNLGTLALNNALKVNQLHFTEHAFLKLKRLCLWNMGDLQVLRFDDKSAEKLEKLELVNLQSLHVLRFDDKSVEKLEQLRLSNLRNLDDVKGIESLRSLQKLYLQDLKPKAISSIEELRKKNKNDPKVIKRENNVQQAEKTSASYTN